MTKFILTVSAFFNFGIIIFTQIVVAKILGASADADAMAIAGTVPQYLTAVLGPALSSVFITSFILLREKKGQGADESFLGLIFLAELISGLSLVGVAILINGPINALLFPSIDDKTRDLVSMLFPLYMFLGMIRLLVDSQVAFFNSNKKFYLPAIARIAISVVALALIPVTLINFGIIGVVLIRVCSLTLFCVSIFASLKINWRRIFQHASELKNSLSLAFAAALAGGLMKITLVIERHFASTLGTGMTFKVLLASSAALTIFAIMTGSVRLVTVVNMTELAAKNKNDELRAAVIRSLKTALPIMFLSVIALGLFARPTLQLILSGGKWQAGDSDAVALAFYGYLPAFVLWGLANAVFYPVVIAHRRQWTMVLIFLPVGFIHFALCKFLTPALGAFGIGLSTSIVSLYWCSMIYVVALRLIDLRLNFMRAFELAKLALPGVVAAALAVIAVYELRLTGQAGVNIAQASLVFASGLAFMIFSGVAIGETAYLDFVKKLPAAISRRQRIR